MQYYPNQLEALDPFYFWLNSWFPSWRDQQGAALQQRFPAADAENQLGDATAGWVRLQKSWANEAFKRASCVWGELHSRMALGDLRERIQRYIKSGGRNRCINDERKRWTRGETSLEECIEIVVGLQDPAARVESAECVARLMEATRKWAVRLKPITLQAVKLRLLDRLSNDDIAINLGLKNAAAAGRRIGRALLELHELLRVEVK